MRKLLLASRLVRTILTFGLLHAAFISFAKPACAQTPAAATGSIIGTLVEEKTGDPVATPVSAGGAFGANSNAKGEFNIKNLPPGTYDITVLKTVRTAKRVISGVVVQAGQPTNLGVIRLEEDIAVALGEIEVKGKKFGELKSAESSSRVEFDLKSKIKNTTATTTEDVISTSAGVVRLGEELFVRGGRSAEVKTVIDGMPVSDSFSGSGGSGTLEVSTTSQEGLSLQTGGMDAEYGNAQSGVIEITTREGSDKFEGNIRFMTDDFGAPDRTYFNYDNVAIGFGGPVPGASKNLKFFVSGEGTFEDTYLKTVENRRARRLYFNDSELISFRDRQENLLTGQGKVTYLLSDAQKLSAEYLFSRGANDWYHHVFSRVGFWSQDQEHWWFEPLDSTYTYYNGPAHLSERKSKADQYKLAYTNPLSPASVLKIRGAMYSNRYKEDVGDKAPGQYVSFNGNNTERDPENLFYAIRGDYPIWEDRESVQYTLRSDYTKKIGSEENEGDLKSPSSAHEIKTGVTLDYFDFTKDARQYPTEDVPLGNLPNIYNENAVGGVVYVQDRLRYRKSMVMNVGMRFDFFDPGENAIRVANQRVLALEKPTKGTSFLERWKAQVSPRIGMSYPISDRDVLHFHYGRFFQLPDLELLYDFSNNPTVGNRTVGNPFLEPETTISYQFGVRRKLTDDVFIDSSVFFKDIFGLVGTVTLENERESEQNDFAPTIFVNQDYGSVRGFEVSLERRFTNFWQGGVTYTLSRATGSSSDVNQGAVVANQGLDREPIQEVPLDWDRTHVFNSFLYFSDPGIWAINFDFALGSGSPTTPRRLGQRSTQAEDINTIRLPNTMTLNLRANKLYRLYGREFRLFLDGRNVLDRQNVRTDLPTLFPDPANEYYREYFTEFGQLGGAYNLKDTIGTPDDVLVPLNDPRVWGEPRNFRVGIAFEW